MDLQYYENYWIGQDYKRSLKLSDVLLKEAERDIGHLVNYCRYLEQFCEQKDNDIQLMDRNFRKWTGSSFYGQK